MTQYTATIINDSGEPWDMYMFQRNPNVNDPHLKTLAWFAKYAAANSTVAFQWDLTYDFMWSQIGLLVPGVQFKANQTFPADPYVEGIASVAHAANQAVLTYHSANEYFEFTPNARPLTDTTRGTLYVRCDATVPNGVASVGIGMSGAGTFARPAQTNITSLFTPEPTYYVAAAVNIQQGQVLEEDISQAVQLTYDQVTGLTATFTPDHTWVVTNG